MLGNRIKDYCIALRNESCIAHAYLGRHMPPAARLAHRDHDGDDEEKNSNKQHTRILCDACTQNELTIIVV